jgi:hypothetical protein
MSQEVLRSQGCEDALKSRSKQRGRSSKPVRWDELWNSSLDPLPKINADKVLPAEFHCEMNIGHTRANSNIDAPKSRAYLEPNTVTRSAAMTPSAGLSVVTPGTGADTRTTPQHSTNALSALNTKGNDMQFVTMGGMHSPRGAEASNKSGSCR